MLGDILSRGCPSWEMLSGPGSGAAVPVGGGRCCPCPPLGAAGTTLAWMRSHHPHCGGLSLLHPGLFVLGGEPGGTQACWGPSLLGAVVTGTSLTHCPPTQGLEVPLVAVIQWSTPKLPFTSSIYTHYRCELPQESLMHPVPEWGGEGLPRSSCPKEGDPEILLPVLVSLTSRPGAAT